MPRILHIDASPGEASRIGGLLCERFAGLSYRCLDYARNLAEELSREDWAPFLVEQDIPAGALRAEVLQ